MCINPKETDAFVHRGKRARGAIPAYVVGVLANEDRIIVGHDVHPSNEISMVSKKLNQVSKIAGKYLKMHYSILVIFITHPLKSVQNAV